VVSPPDCGTGSIVEPSRYADEDEEREAALRAQAEEHDMVERQWAAYVREQDARGNARDRS
jgi:hypothetical protein